MQKRSKVVFGASALAAALVPVGAASAASGGSGGHVGGAPGPQIVRLSCTERGTVTVRVAENNSSDNGGFSAATIIAGGSGTLIPMAFTFSAYDVNTQTTIFSSTQLKGGGHANPGRTTQDCSFSQTGMLGDLLQPGDTLPPGASLTDTVITTFTATAFLVP